MGEAVRQVKSLVRATLGAWRRRVDPVPWHALRLLEPMSRRFGMDRGRPIDRHYIDAFLDAHRADVRGRVLEVAEATYTQRFGDDRVTQSDVLHAVEGNPAATIVGDLATGRGLPDDAFDCIILTEVLPFIYDVHGVVRTLARTLRPGGVVLATACGISQISRYDMDRWGDYWRFTSLSLRRLFEEAFAKDAITVQSSGNVLAATAFLHGISAEELTADELAHHDPDYELLLTVRAVRQ
jgi:SAM-dependent methyltransferase